MLVNIWATIIHLSDRYFSAGPEGKKASLDLLVCEQLQAANPKKEQIWMINPVWQMPGTTESLLRESYRAFRDSEESYLVLLTPGFADIVKGVPVDLIERNMRQICKRARAFNKKVIISSPGVPPGCPAESSRKIKELEEAINRLTGEHQGFKADLENIVYEPWTKEGSRPVDLRGVAEKIAATIIHCHPSTDDWKKLHGK